MELLDNRKTPTKYSCIICSFYSNNLKDYKRHCQTIKHVQSELDNKKPQKPQKNPNLIFVCKYCDKSYKYRSGLSKHLPKCKDYVEKNFKDQAIKEKDDILMEMLDKNKELQNIIVEQNKQISELIPKVGTTTNNTFNLNVFLNEECKDAINWTEFINSIEFELSNLQELTQTNITKSITNAVCNKINELGVYKRPIHCLDHKRRKLCIKNKEEWEKDDDKVNSLIDKSDKELQHKYVVLINKWEKENPGWENDDKLVEEYMDMSSKIYQNIDNIKYKIELMKEASIPK
tara:strand:- start:1257 stop:2123 length:867 start_codon:yes stop_codon:yes gene_type:complete